MFSTAIIVLSVVSSLLMFVDITPEPKPDPYADLGMLCIAIVMIALPCVVSFQVWKIYRTWKNLKAEV